MKTRFSLVLVFLAGLVLGALYSPLRYTFAAAASLPVLWRGDRLTGRAACTFPGEAWQETTDAPSAKEFLAAPAGWTEVPEK